MSDNTNSHLKSWQTYYSERSNRNYYYHPELKILTWILPDAIDSVSSQESSSDADIVEARGNSKTRTSLYRIILSILLRIIHFICNEKLFLWIQALLFVHGCCILSELDCIQVVFGNKTCASERWHRQCEENHNEIPYLTDNLPEVSDWHKEGHIVPLDLDNTYDILHSFDVCSSTKKHPRSIEINQK
jgi:hypothetical protein